MPELVTEMVGGEPYEYYPLGQYVVRAPGICGGRPTFKYSRIEITFVLGLIAAGHHVDDLINNSKGRLSHEAINEAMRVVNARFLDSLPDLALAS